jgi:hypothetical protein
VVLRRIDQTLEEVRILSKVNRLREKSSIWWTTLPKEVRKTFVRREGVLLQNPEGADRKDMSGAMRRLFHLDSVEL